jgi:hypothetical protein
MIRSEGLPQIDQARLVEALILFDQVVLESYRLLELPSLVAAFGVDGLTALIETGALRIQFVPHVLAEGGHPASPTIFRFLYVTVPQPERHLDVLLPDARVSLEHLAEGQFARIEAALRVAQTDVPMDAGTSALGTLYTALLEERPILRRAVELVSGKPVPEGARFNATKIERATYHVDPAWTRHLPSAERQRITQQALLAVGHVALRFEKMRLHHALSGFRPNDLPLIDEQLRFLEDQLNASHHVTAFRRVLEIADLPTIEKKLSTSFIDIDALLKVRQSRETLEFRAWLWGIHDASEQELHDRVGGFAATMGQFLSTKKGKTLRWITSTGVGLIPVVGNLAGAAIGAADTFLLEHVFPQRGVVTFLGSLYPSIFTATPQT